MTSNSSAASKLAPMMRKTLDKLRMLAWLLTGLALYSLSTLVGAEHPAVQTILYKLGHVTTLAWVGYWIARNAIGRIDALSSPNERLSRAVLIGSVILAGSMGL